MKPQKEKKPADKLMEIIAQHQLKTIEALKQLQNDVDDIARNVWDLKNRP